MNTIEFLVQKAVKSEHKIQIKNTKYFLEQQRI